MTQFNLHTWSVSPAEIAAFKALSPGACVKVLYEGGEGGESNWTEILEHRDGGFWVKPDRCLFYSPPAEMFVRYENIKQVYSA
jgi:hypothetical protein